MESNTCMNMLCRATKSSGWTKGWALRSGQFATLCDNCGSAYAQSNFCDVFHSEESGWRHCSSCDKRLHCGCIASVLFIEILDGGGVRCIGCPKSPEDNSETGDENPDGVRSSKVNDPSELQSSPDDNLIDGERKFMQLGSYADATGMRHILQLQNGETNDHVRQMKQEYNLPSMGEIESTSFSNFKQESSGISQAAIPEIVKSIATATDLYDPLVQTNLSITLGPVRNPNAFPGVVIEERAQSKASSSLQQGPRARHLLPKPPKSAIATGLEANAGMVSQIRVARPPVEGRGRNQLLPRYWPRITDQELQQISGDSNSTIVPLFEKVLSASDAGRIGRLVLPKACAEAYFPPISQPEGLPIRIQDVKGKEWVFQFRFWPNNNSRMYVLEGVTPCIQSMQLQAGDTVTFSRMDPEGKLVMGFRKASNSVMMQESPSSAIASGVQSSESLFSGVFENLPMINGYSGLLQSLKGRTNTHLSAFSKHLNSAGGDVNWHKSDDHDDQTKKSLILPLSLIPERKRTRNIGSKSKRLLFDSLDALELKLTWEEIQDLLRPPPSVKPNIITVEDHDFEEYDEPPVFGKRSVFIVRSIGEQEQWASCDNCSKWRRLPVDFLLPPKWTCNENAWDQKSDYRCSCSAPEELTPSELENLLGRYKDFKKRRITIYHRADQEPESSGLDALANAAILGDMSDPSTTAIATTTKHPRHRPGCSCIVCIQPPSGKGKHKPTCTCNVCLTVKRRFKTLMMRKKKRQSEREAEIAQKNQNMWVPKGDAEVDSSSKLVSTHLVPSENEARTENDLESKIPINTPSSKMADNGKGNIDLNCYPDREEDSQAGLRRTSTMSLLKAASLPLETYLKQNGLTSLVSEQQAGSASYALARGGESEGGVHEDCQLAPATNKQESGGEDNNNCGTGLVDQSGSDPV